MKQQLFLVSSLIFFSQAHAAPRRFSYSTPANLPSQERALLLRAGSKMCKTYLSETDRTWSANEHCLLFNRWVYWWYGYKSDFRFYHDSHEVVGVARVQADKCYLESFAISESVRGTGVAQQFMREILRDPALAACKQVTLSFYPANTRAQQFYRKMGFTVSASAGTIDLEQFKSPDRG